MTTSNFDPLTYAIGAREVASVHAGRLIGADREAFRRLREAEGALIAARATDVAGLLTKLEIVFDHANDNRDHFGRLVTELEACQREAAEPGADLAHVADALTVLSRSFERENASDFDVRLLQSAALDARTLAAKPLWTRGPPPDSHCHPLMIQAGCPRGAEIAVLRRAFALGH